MKPSTRRHFLAMKKQRPKEEAEAWEDYDIHITENYWQKGPRVPMPKVTDYSATIRSYLPQCEVDIA